MIIYIPCGHSVTRSSARVWVGVYYFRGTVIFRWTPPHPRNDAKVSTPSPYSPSPLRSSSSCPLPPPATFVIVVGMSFQLGSTQCRGHAFCTLSPRCFATPSLCQRLFTNIFWLWFISSGFRTRYRLCREHFVPSSRAVRVVAIQSGIERDLWLKLHIV